MTKRFWVETLGCPKNQVDSDKLTGTLLADGLAPADGPERADLVVVNTCAFIEAARQESVDTILGLAAVRRPGAQLVVTGCLAERAGDELAAALPEVDLVAGFGVPLTAAGSPGRQLPVRPTPAFDLLELPRPPAAAPWAYVKVAEGCDRRCGFCAIPSFRGPQRSRSQSAVLAEVSALGPGVAEVVLVAQDLASWGLDRSSQSHPPVRRSGCRPLVGLVDAVTSMVPRVRLLYLYPSSLDDALVDAILRSGVPYFDLSLQHVARPLLRRMRRWGSGDVFLERIEAIRAQAPGATFRSSFIVGYPGETEDDHDELLAFLEAARLDWAGFFPFSPEEGTPAAGMDGSVPASLVGERLAECVEVQDAITEEKRRATVGTRCTVLVDEPGVGRSWREAPEIDGVVHLPDGLPVGAMVDVEITAAAGPDLWGVPVDRPGAMSSGAVG
jgi:ribosomal protein S12 methylthiotransferase